jgi:hypothetical protein
MKPLEAKFFSQVKHFNILSSKTWIRIQINQKAWIRIRDSMTPDPTLWIGPYRWYRRVAGA